MERTQSRGPTHRARNDTDVPGTARWASHARALPPSGRPQEAAPDLPAPTLPAPAVPLPVDRASSRTSERGREGPRGCSGKPDVTRRLSLPSPYILGTLQPAFSLELFPIEGLSLGASSLF